MIEEKAMKDEVVQELNKKVERFNEIMEKECPSYNELLEAHGLFVQFAQAGILDIHQQLAVVSNILGKTLKELGAVYHLT